MASDLHPEPLKSFVDAPFFAELAKWKLNDAKLSEESVAVTGSCTVPASGNRPPAVRITGSSLGDSDAGIVESPFEYTLKGTLTNYNTLEAFRDLNKIAFANDAIQSLKQHLADPKTWATPESITNFRIITFADLKKYKFYYWFLFPALRWDGVRSLNDEPSQDLNAAIESFGQMFFAIHRTDEGFAVDSLDTVTHEIGLVDFGTVPDRLPYYLGNLVALVKHHTKLKSVRVYVFNDAPHATGRLRSHWLDIDLETSSTGNDGWERNSQGKLLPKLTDLSSLINPVDLADQAVDLNLKLMKWRAAPDIDLDCIKHSKCLLLGAGTLGCYVARGLLAWGVRKITFVDSGRVSYSNPVRQSLFKHEDSVNASFKAKAAAQSLKDIFPGVDAQGHVMEIPMAGHPVTSEERQHKEYDELVRLIDENDVIFLLMDSRESRWLPTVICQAKRKLVINVAIGFDSFLVMRHGVPGPEGEPSQLGCYYCNDVVAPIDSQSKLTLDQMCTVTRPGVAMLSSGQAIELTAQVLQHPLKARAPADAETVFGDVPHQLRGFLRRHETASIWGPSFKNCSGCGPAIVDEWKEHGWKFVKQALNDREYVTELSGLGELQRRTEELDFDEPLSSDDFE